MSMTVTASKIRPLEPSAKLQHLIDNCVSGFKRLEDAVAAALEQGRKEGYTDKQTGGMIRERMLKLGYRRETISRALPPTAKNRPRGRTVSDKMSQNKNLCEQCEQDITEGEFGKYEIKPEDYNIRDLRKYDRNLLEDIIKYLDKRLETLLEKNEILVQGTQEDDTVIRNLEKRNKQLEKELADKGGNQ